MTTEQELQTTVNSKFDIINANFDYLNTQNKGSVKSITSKNATVTITKGDNTSSTITINNVAQATKATQDGNGNIIANTYATKDQVTALSKFNIEVVNELPTQNISTTTIYLKPSENSTTGDLYAEYIYINYKWEKLGEQTTDFTNYYTKTQTDQAITTAVENKANDSAVVHKTGNETISGTKTFSTKIVGTIDKAVSDDTGRNIVNTYATKTELNSKANDSAVVHKTGNETIAGVKTFSSTISGSISGNAATAIKATQDGEGNVITDTYATMTTTGNIADLETTAKDSLVDAINELHNTTPSIESVVHIGGAETITGAKTFTSIINGSISGNAATATKATQDGSGNTITSTYIKSLSISGTTITVKKGDDTSSTITTQDNKVQSVVSAGNAKYPIHLNNGTTATTNTVLIDTGIYANPSTNTVGADTLSLASKVNMTYNSTLSSVDFEFV